MVATTRPSSIETSRSTPRSTSVSIGISGSLTRPAAARARSIASVPVGSWVRSITVTTVPPSLRVGAGDDLHLGEQLRQGFGVESVATLLPVHADSGEAALLGPVDAGCGEDLVEDDSG